MPNNWKQIALGVFLVFLTFPEWNPVLGLGIDPSCAWLYNYLLVEQPHTLARLIFPHGPLDFLQSPLPIGFNLEIALAFDVLLRLLFVWSGLLILPSNSPKRFWIQVVLLTVGLILNRMDVLLFATSAQFILLALQKNKTSWLYPAAFLSVIGLFTKTAIGMPGTLLLGAATVYLSSSYQKIPSLLAGVGIIPAFAALLWYSIIGNMDGFVQMMKGTLYLIQGNSSAVCHYPPNNWFLLGTFWSAWIAWPLLVGKEKIDRLYWGMLSLPLFAFWKYGIAREDIWHLYTSYRAVLWTIGTLLILHPKWNSKILLLALMAVGSFYLNLRSAEGFVHFAIKPLGWKRAYEWTFHFNQKKRDAVEMSNSAIAPHKLPDSIRNYIGNKTVDIFPWHYTYAAANQFNLQPRHIPQSYAAYHPWLDQLDSTFFTGTKAPEILLIHLKNPSEMGQFMGIDDRYLLQDAPKTLLAITNHYKVVFRQPNYLILERSAHKHLISSKSFPYTHGWQPPKGQTGIALLKIPFQQSWIGQLKSVFYKSDPILADVYLQNFQRRIKLVPALTKEGVWIAPWLEDVSSGKEPFLLPDSIKLVAGNKNWASDPSNWQIEWIEVDTTGEMLPTHWKPASKALQKVGALDIAETVAANGFSSNWKQAYTWDTKSQTPPEFTLTAFVQSPINAGCGHLVMSTYDSTGNEIHYQSTEYCGMGIGTAMDWPVSLKVRLPQNTPAHYDVKAYWWNAGNKEIQLKKLEIWKAEQ